MAIPVLRMLTIGLLPSPLKIAYYRMRGAKIGKRVSIGLLSVITARRITIGDDAKIGLLSFINLRRDLRIGARVRLQSMVAVDTGSLSIDDDTTIMEQVIIGGMLTPRSEISIGKRVKVFPHAFLNPTEKITIEDDVGVGGASYIFTHGSWQNILDGFQASFGPVHIKKGAWLPWRVFVLPGVTIGESAIIGPAAVVTQSVPDFGVASGMPAEVRDLQGRHIRKLTPKHKDKTIRKILDEYVEYQNYAGSSCALIAEPKGGAVLDHAGKRIIYRGIEPATPDGPVHYLISLNAIDGGERERLARAGACWFDIENKQSIADRSFVAGEIRAYFSRYGIRFDLQNDF